MKAGAGIFSGESGHWDKRSEVRCVNDPSLSVIKPS